MPEWETIEIAAPREVGVPAGTNVRATSHGEDAIEVTVVDIRGDTVSLGINAPKEISVHRKEVYDAIRRENRAAAQVKPEDVSGVAGKSPGAAAPEAGAICEAIRAGRVRVQAEPLSHLAAAVTIADMVLGKYLPLPRPAPLAAQPGSGRFTVSR